LVFFEIATSQETVSVCLLIELNPGVMTRGHFLTVQACSEPYERREFQAAVARYTRDRRLALKIAIYEWLYDVAFKITFEIEHVKRNPEFLTTRTGAENLAKRTTPGGQRSAFLIDVYAPPLVPQLHRKANEFVTLPLQNRCCGGRVDSATHCYCYF